MKYLKSILLMFLIGMTATATITAQEIEAVKEIRKERVKKTPEERVQANTDRLVKRLDLSEEQAAKIYEINMKYASEAKVERAERKAKKEQQASEIKAVLDEKQAAKFDKMAQKRKHKMRKNRRGKRELKQDDE